MKDERAARVHSFSAAGARAGFLACACCGRRFVPKRSVMLLGGDLCLSGPICPDCVILGPKGAASRLRRRVRAKRPGERETLGARALRAIEPWERLADRRADALERTESFPLEAREAAIRETRETR